jgi:hypothetical protein
VVGSAETIEYSDHSGDEAHGTKGSEDKERAKGKRGASVGIEGERGGI